jgi:hypothetical protein
MGWVGILLKAIIFGLQKGFGQGISHALLLKRKGKNHEIQFLFCLPLRLGGLARVSFGFLRVSSN